MWFRYCKTGCLAHVFIFNSLLTKKAFQLWKADILCGNGNSSGWSPYRRRYNVTPLEWIWALRRRGGLQEQIWLCAGFRDLVACMEWWHLKASVLLTSASDRIIPKGLVETHAKILSGLKYCRFGWICRTFNPVLLQPCSRLPMSLMIVLVTQ